MRASSMCLIAGLLLSSCGCQLKNWKKNGFKVGPEYCPVSASHSTNWIDTADPRVTTVDTGCPEWWSAFNDPVLNNLIETAFRQNLTLREAGWRVMQARNQRAIAGGNRFPQTQQGFAQYDRVLDSKNLATSGPLRVFDEWSTGLSVSWELDLWGRFRRSIASADADIEVSVGDYDAILLCLIADVATAYADYRTFAQRLEYAKNNVDIQEGSLRISTNKASAGATGFTSVHLAKSSLLTTRAAIPSLQTGQRQAANQLCTLLGMPTQDLTAMLGPGGIPTASADVAIGIPADLMRRRPDIRAAERSVAAQSEQIGIAVADLYPAFFINGEIAFDSEKFSHLITSASNAGSIGPAFQWNLLNYGRIQNNVRLQESGYQELITSYQNTVLSANQEVEDALIEFLRNQEREQFLQESVKETAEALRLLQISFDEGQINFAAVFVMQGELVRAQDQLAQTQGNVVTSLISLYKALGGGWEVRCQGFQACTVSSASSDVPDGDGTVELEFLPPAKPPAMPNTTEPAAAPELPQATGVSRPNVAPPPMQQTENVPASNDQLELENAMLKRLLGEAQLNKEILTRALQRGNPAAPAARNVSYSQSRVSPELKKAAIP